MKKELLKNIPSEPGIYQFFDSAGKIIYIGKSVNLKSRVHSYFNGKAKLNFAKKKMVGQIKDIKTIVVNNETESLILERTLIKKHIPKYNVLLKDDKNYLYIKITKDAYPKIIRTRVAPKGGVSKYDRNYFGPYISTQYVFNIFKILKKYFGYGIANHHFFHSKQSYNLDKYLFEGNLKNTSQEEIHKIYHQKIDEIRAFLSGDFSDILKDLDTKMRQAAKNLEFEKAAELKSYIASIKSLEDSQIVRDGIKGDYDIVNYIEKYEKHFIGLIEVRESKITGYYNYEIENNLGEEKEELLKIFIENRYAQNIENNQKICFITPFNTDIRYPDTHIEIPKIGAKHDLLKLCYKNIYEYAHKKHIASLSTKSFTKKTMQGLLNTLGYGKINNKILFECNDISHLSGSHTVASRSVIINGKKDPQKYRKFRIKKLEDGKVDDFDSMREIMERRLKEIEKTGVIPDLIIIDGGKGQLSSVVEIIQNYDPQEEKNKNLIEKLQLIGLAKQEEDVFLPGESQPILLEKGSEHLRLIQAIRDEAHRFAITFNRDSRSKSMKKNILESLPGIGPKTRKKILKEFGSLEGLQKADKEKQKKVLSKSILEILENHGLI